MNSMTIIPANMPSALPTGPAFSRYKVVVNRNEPHPIAVPTDSDHAPIGDKYASSPSSRSLTEPYSSI